MTTLYHPHIADTTVDVPTDRAAAWVAQGWLRTDPSKPRKPRSGKDTPTEGTNA